MTDSRQHAHRAESIESAEEFAERLFSSILGFTETLAVALGDRLGWYRALARASDAGLDARSLAAETGTSERYAREWLEHQAVGGTLIVSDGRFVLPPGAAEVLTDERSLAYSAPVARMLAASGAQFPQLLDAYRTGGGVSWDRFGDEARESQADVNRPWFERELASALSGAAGLHAVLETPGARIVDVGCGYGWSTIALARAYPRATVLGVDIDEPSIVAARRNAAEQEAVVEFRALDGAGLAGAGPFDVAFVFEALHDMPDPVAVLAALRAELSEGGVVIVMDEAVAPEFAPDGDEVERLMYGYSLLVCLPDGLSTPGSVGTGTVMRPAILDGYAREAGFAGAETLPIDGFAAFRFYRLTPL